MLEMQEANLFNLKDSQVLSRFSIALPASVASSAEQQFQCDCACEGGLERHATLATLTTAYSSAAVPRRLPHLYNNNLGHYHLYYNPQFDAGTVILSRAANALLQAIDGQLSLLSLYEWAQKQDPTAHYEDIVGLIQNFERHGLVDFSANNTVSNPRFAASKKLGIWLHVTNQCNLRCTYCYLGKTSELMSFETGQRILQELIDNAEQQGMQEISLKFAGGEALLEWELVQALNNWARAETARRNMRLESILLSNGTTITARLARQLKEQNFQVAVSLDGLGEANDVQRPFVNGRGSARYVERGMLLLQEYAVPFNVSVVVTAQNLAGLPALAEFLLNRDQPIPFTLSFFRDNPLAQDGLAVDNPELIAGLRQLYSTIETVLSKRTPAFSFMDTLLDRVQLSQPHQHACGAGVNYVVVKHTGEIATCQMLLHKPVGKSGQPNQDIIKLIRAKGPNPMPSQQKEGCASCQWRFVCAGGCPIVTLRTTGRYDTRSPYCDTYFTLIPEVLRLEGLRLLGLATTN